MQASFSHVCLNFQIKFMSPQGSDERSHIREHKPPDWPSP